MADSGGIRPWTGFLVAFWRQRSQRFGQFFDPVPAGKELGQFGGELRVAGQQLLAVQRLAFFQSFHTFDQHLFESPVPPGR